MNQSTFECFCKKQVQLQIDKLKQHISDCQIYQRESPFKKEFNKLPKDKLQLVHLLAIKSEFLSYVDEIDALLKLCNFYQLNDHFLEGNDLDYFQNFSNPQAMTKSLQLMTQSKIKILPNNPIDTTAFKKSAIICTSCKNEFDDGMDWDKIWYIYACLHPYCKACLNKQIQKEYVQNDGVVKCLQCKAEFVSEDFEGNLDQEKKGKLDEKLIEKQFNIVKCIKCNDKFSFENGSNNQVNLKDPNTQKQLSRELVDHYVLNRFTCLQNNCKTEQCRNCSSTPYHLGMTCEQFAIKKSSKRCRYCDQTIHQINKNCIPSLSDICTQQECAEKMKIACTQTLRCGHGCPGFLNETQCLPCLREECSQNNDSDTKGDDYCNICYVEGIAQAPCIRTECSHVFHYACILKRLEYGWNGPRIVFNFCLCPLCKQWMQFSPGCKPQALMNQYQVLLEDVKKKSIERLKFEGKEKDKRLISPEDPYFNKPQEYSLAIYCYYQCFKCKKPYFGGAKDCQRAMEDEKKEFDPKELICGNCCEVQAGDTCPKHGKEYIEYKCRFCCSLAVWFCWGSTHFCEPCHKRQVDGDYVSKYTKDKLPKCAGKDKCPLKIEHHPNGDESALGCSICRNQKENAKNF